MLCDMVLLTRWIPVCAWLKLGKVCQRCGIHGSVVSYPSWPLVGPCEKIIVPAAEVSIFHACSARYEENTVIHRSQMYGSGLAMPKTHLKETTSMGYPMWHRLVRWPIRVAYRVMMGGEQELMLRTSLICISLRHRVAHLMMMMMMLGHYTSDRFHTWYTDVSSRNWLIIAASLWPQHHHGSWRPAMKSGPHPSGWPTFLLYLSC